jgi:hypothetical protein
VPSSLRAVGDGLLILGSVVASPVVSQLLGNVVSLPPVSAKKVVRVAYSRESPGQHSHCAKRSKN